MSIIYRKNGFTLIEMAMVLMIVGLLLGSLMVPIAARIEQGKIADTQQTEATIIEALLGYAIANGRLPCPASATSYGAESFASGGNESNGLCSNFYNGWVPAVTLGLSNVDPQGYAVDAWNNRIHYAVTIASSNAFTKTNGISLNSTADLYVCASASANGSGCSVANSILSATAPALIYSLGKNAATAGNGADEAENPNPNSADNDKIFVSHSPSASSASGGEFDDLVTWMSTNILLGRLVAAGKLP
jgi:prepilin-type N-terminal cleavage/methylation domain-containing protein